MTPDLRILVWTVALTFVEVLVAVSVAVIDCIPAVSKVALKVCTPASPLTKV